jgi:hypothetical protein
MRMEGLTNSDNYIEKKMIMRRSRETIPVEALQAFILAYFSKGMKYTVILAHGSWNLHNIHWVRSRNSSL